MIKANNTILSTPYTRKVGRTTFLISSFGNPGGTETATEMLLHIMEQQLMQKRDKEEETYS